MANSDVCGPYSQTLFMGASIISFSASLGWNGDQGRLQVELVEDQCRSSKVYYDARGNPAITNNQDFFNPPKIGSPVIFRFGSFTFGGLLQGWEQQKDTKGGTTYSINIVDTSEILEGCQIIINNYTGSTFGIPNLINAFGFTEELNSSCSSMSFLDDLNPPLMYTPAPGFGGSNVAEDGMSWFQIRDALSVLTVVPNKYGGQLQLRDYRYYLDISELPPLDTSFRISGDNISLMEIISQVCSSTGMDFFLELVSLTPNTVPASYGGISGLIHPSALNIIKIRVVSRYIQRTSAYNIDFTIGTPVDLRLNFGKISQFVGNGAGRSRTSRGLELRSDITNSFLVGDNRQDLWMQAYTGSANSYTDTIWPYWGKDFNNNVIISNGINNNHNFTISTESFGPDLRGIIGTIYNITMLEIRAALAGMEEWALFMWSQKSSLAAALDLDSSFVTDFVSAISTASAKPRPDDLKRTDTAAMKRAFKHAGADPDSEEIDKAELQKRLYDIVRSYGELAGKKFMVALPLICTAPDSSAPFSTKLNWEPSDGAWTDANVQLHSLATSLPQNSPILELLRLDDGRLGCFVYFNTQSITKLIDYSQLSPDEVIPISSTECYVKGVVEEIVFLNKTAQTYPRAIVSINNMIAIKADENNEVDAKIIDSLIAVLANASRDWLDKKASSFGDDTNKLSLFPLPMLPLGAAVPLRSSNLSYGPWITTLAFGPASRTSYERDTNINPWAFGSSQLMNYAGQIKVETQVTQQIVSESGSLTVPGSPPGRLGDVLMAGGPEITNIDMEVSTGGVTTTVRLRTFVPNFGEIGRRRVQILRNAGTYQQKLQRAFLNRNASRLQQNAFANLTRPFVKTDRFDRHSSHTVIVGEYFSDYASDTGLLRSNIVITDLRKALPETYQDYGTKALMDLGGLFRAFESSGVAGHNLPAFSSIVPTTSSPVTSLSLNPFKHYEKYNGTSVGHDIEYITRGNIATGISDLSIKKSNSYGDENIRGIGLRTPLVLVGWGFDTSDKPVPNKTPGSIPSNNFADNYLQRPDLWKAGPLDVRWDDSRGVWSAAGGSVFRIARLQQNLIPGNSASGNLGTVTLNSTGGSFTIAYESGLTRIYDGLKNFSTVNYPAYPATPSGAVVYVNKEQTSNAYFLVGASVW